MGIGDEIMASGHALTHHKETGKRVRILDVYNRPRWSELWDGLPWIARPKDKGDFATIRNGPQCRPYVRYPFTREGGQKFTDWRARDHIGAIELTATEKAFAHGALHPLAGGPFAVLEPNLSSKANPNKQWGSGKWQALADILIHAGLCVVQVGGDNGITLQGAVKIHTPTFRHGAAILKQAAAAVLPEGGLHHAAGVMGVPAVVLFGGMISPETTGYPAHVNLDSPPPCGKWTHCRHCARIWASLKPEAVAAELDKILRRKAA